MKPSSNSSGTLSLGTITASILAANAYGSEVTLNAVNSGFYNLYGNSSQSLGYNGNTLLLGPWSPGGTPLYHNWLAFDMSLVEGTVISATLQIYSAAQNTSGQTILWRGVTTPYPLLGLPGTTAADKDLGKQIFNEMGAGEVYGQGIHAAGTVNNFTLSASAIEDLNAAADIWAISGESLDPIPSPDNLNIAYGYNSVAFGFNSSWPHEMQLKLEVEPGVNRFAALDIPADVPEAGSTLAMLGLGLLGSVALRNRVTNKK